MGPITYASPDGRTGRAPVRRRPPRANPRAGGLRRTLGLAQDFARRVAAARAGTRAGATGNGTEAGDFWREKSVAELAAEQGATLAPDLDALIGSLADAWASDAEFDAFIREIGERRRDAATR